jgi:hypothetical protein
VTEDERREREMRKKDISYVRGFISALFSIFCFWLAFRAGRHGNIDDVYGFIGIGILGIFVTLFSIVFSIFVFKDND